MVEPRKMVEGVAVWCRFDELAPVVDLREHPKNNNTHPDRQIRLLAKIISESGWRAPITVSRLSGFITKGRGRLLAARVAEMVCVPVEYQGYTDEAAELADLLADNKIADMAEFDDEMTRALLLDLRDLDIDFEVAGFELSEVDKLISLGSVGDTDPDDVPDVDTTVPARSLMGRVWALDDHRLICGDASRPADIQAVVGADLAHMVFTDPPYNVNYQGQKKKRKKIENDNLSDVDFRHLMDSAFAGAIECCVGGAAIYICHADLEWRSFREAMIGAGWLLKQCLVWEKNGFILGRQDYHWRHEPILYGWKPADPGTGGHRWYGGRKQDTVITLPDGVLIEDCGEEGVSITVDIGLQRIVLQVPSYEVVFSGDDALQSIWKVAKPMKSEEHPTMKPVELIERAIRNSSRPGDIVLDMFCGSGSTLIACETTGRRARVVELDPHYCDVIVKRWEEFTGGSAELV